MLAFPRLIVVAPSMASLPLVESALTWPGCPELLDWLRRHKSPALAESGMTRLPELPERCVVPAELALPALAVWAKHSAECRYVLLVEAPERALAAELPPAQGLAAWTLAWVQRHSELLRQLQRLRQRFLAVDLDEWLQQPQAMAALEAQAAIARPRFDGPSALARLLAASLLDGCGELRALASELHQSCLPLGSTQSRVDDCLKEWLQLQQNQGRLVRLDQQLTETEGQLNAARSAEASTRKALEDRLREAEQQLLQSRASEADARKALEGRLREAEQQLLQSRASEADARKALEDRLREQQADLAATQRAAAQAGERLTACRAELEASQQLQAGLRTELDAMRRRGSELELESESVRSELALLRPQFVAIKAEMHRLVEAQARSEQDWLAERESLRQDRQRAVDEARLLSAGLTEAQAKWQGEQLRLAQQLAELTHQLDERSTELGAADHSCEALQSALDALKVSSAAALVEERQRAECQIQALRTENELLTQQLQQFHHQVLGRMEEKLAQQRAEIEQERAHGRELLVELHRLQAELQLSEDRAQTLLLRGTGDALALTCALESLEIELERSLPPHCELHLTLGGLRLDDRCWDRLPLRLLDHSGHVGLALQASQPPLIGPWRVDATEGEAGERTELMLLIPDDAASQQLLDDLPASDWDRLQTLLARLRVELERLPPASGARWPQVLLRLQAQLEGRPPRLRYDAIEFEADGPVWRLQVHRVLLGRRRWPRLELRWRPDHAEPLSLAIGEGEAAPLLAWPHQADGRAQSELSLPLGRAQGPSELAANPDDRLLLQALIDSLPGLAEQAAAQHAGAAGLPAAARRLQVDWARRSAGGRLKRLLRGLRRRA